jgi:transcriptional regulator GlxA family with amidase domain
VPELAKALDLAPRTLTQRFHEAGASSPAFWIRTQRIQNAAGMLRQGKSPTEVSRHLGYSSPFHFSRQFKAIRGVPPSAVRAGASTTLHASAKKGRDAPKPTQRR